jgi:hypothetical protein
LQVVEAGIPVIEPRVLFVPQLKLHETIQKFDIIPPNIYNSNEKGFLIGLSRSSKRIVSTDALKNKGTIGNQEFITLISAIWADGSRLAPTLIYQSAVGVASQMLHE